MLFRSNPGAIVRTGGLLSSTNHRSGQRVTFSDVNVNTQQIGTCLSQDAVEREAEGNIALLL